MTVKELIVALFEFDMEKEIFVSTEDGNEPPNIYEELVGCHLYDDESPSRAFTDPERHRNIRDVIILK